MTGRLLRIRIKQLSEILKQIGLFRTVFLFAIAIMAVAGLYQFTKNQASAIYTTLIISIFMLFVHVKRKDINFLQINCEGLKTTVFIEYAIFSSILPVFLVIQGFYLLAILHFTLLAAWVQITPKSRQSNATNLLVNWIPPTYFEWKSGFRRIVIVLLLAELITIAFIHFSLAAPIGLIVISILTIPTLEHNESYQMITAYEKPSTLFLFQKIKQQLLMLFMLSLPLLIIHPILHFSEWFYPLLVLLAIFILHIYAVLVKYAFYESSKASSAAQMFITIGLFCMLIPIFIPLLFVLSIYFFFKANQKLSIYLHDYA